MILRLVLILAMALLIFPAMATSSSHDFAEIDTVTREAIASGEIPGAVVLVGRGSEVLYLRAFGQRAVIPESAPMTPTTIFDIASLTKPLGTTLAVMALAERGKISLDAPLGRYLSEFDGGGFREVTIRRMLTHSAGFPGIVPETTLNGGFPRAARALAQLKLDYPPGTGFQYSDVGFMLLGEVVRRVSGEPLDRYLTRAFVKPMGLRDTSFRPPTSARARLAPTERFNGAWFSGMVHDPRARVLGGVAGHAGMFSTASDLARFCQMLTAEGVLDGRRYLKTETVRTMWTRSWEGNGTRALGWDVISTYATGMAPFFPEGSVGHTGFTGTSIWIDPASRTYLIILTNRVHPTGGGAARIRELRTRVTAAAGAALFATEAPTRLAASAVPVVSTESPEPALHGASAAEPTTAPTVKVKSGLDVLAAQNFAQLSSQSVGLVVNHTSLDSSGRRAIDLVAGAPGVRLKAIFAPEHGITGQVDEKIPHGRDVDHRSTHLEPVRSDPAPEHEPAQGDQCPRLRHPGRWGALLHIPDHARLRAGGSSRPRHLGGGARSAQPHHGAGRRGPSDGSRSQVLHGAAHDPRPHGNDHRRVRPYGGGRAENPGITHGGAPRGLGPRALV